MAGSVSLHDVLALRAWALRVLGGEAAVAPPEAPLAAWNRFLAVEACVLPLLSALGQARSALPAAPAALLAAAAVPDQQRFLAARAQSILLGRWADAAGIRAVVLKGGRAAVEGGPPVGLADLDVLVASDDALRMAAFLDEELGFRPAASRELGGHHLSKRIAPASVQVEVHRWIKHLPETARLLADAVPLGPRGVYGLAPEAHLWHLLSHATADHRERRGRLRDLVLLAAAWRTAPPDAREAVRVRAAADAVPAPHLAFLDMAAVLAGGGVPDDAFRTESAARAILVAVRGFPLRMRRDLNDAVFSLLGGRDDRRAYWSRVSFHSPPLRVRAARIARFAAAAVAAIPFSLGARRAGRG